VSGYLTHFVESTLETYLNGRGKVVFIGRSSRPFYNIASTYTESDIEFIDVPRKLLEQNPDDLVFQYLEDSGAFADDTVTLVDDGGRGYFMRKLRGVIERESRNTIDVTSQTLFCLDPRQPCRLYQHPSEAPYIVRSLLFLGKQPHPYRLTGELVEKDGVVSAVSYPTSLSEQKDAQEVTSILKNKALSNAKRIFC